VNEAEIVPTRLCQQLITHHPFHTAAEVVGWLGAVQAQDYPAAKWAVGLRTPGQTDSAIHQAVCAGAILRTHVLRPTWHFVSPADTRWMLGLTAQRVKLALATYDRRLEINEAFLARVYPLLTAALEGGRQLTRAEVSAALRQGGIALDVQLRLGQIMIHAELDGLVCSGAWREKQPTYALLEEWAPAARPLAREEALAELTRRYFISRGPATLKDFTWWSGLTVSDAKAGLAALGSELISTAIKGQAYWLAPETIAPPAGPPGAHLLPNYDEYVVGYTDRSAIFDPAHAVRLDARGNILFNYIMVLDGKLIGLWKRVLRKGAVALTFQPFIPLGPDESHAFREAAAHFAHFLGLPLETVGN
jgi:hypothetical protein